MHRKTAKRSPRGFSLTEVLISLLIIAQIATFTIPKVLTSQQNRQFEASGKEAIATVSAVFQQHLINGKLSSATTFGDLTQYMNYIALDTTTPLDDWQGATPNAGTSCANYRCLRLHNGSKILWDPAESFGGTATTNVISFSVDPDGKITDGTANGPGHSLYIMLYYNGRITDIGNVAPTGTSSKYTWSKNTAAVPSWFTWN
ncbi:MAG TPA: type II secretion system protein [Coleofasciculaceae cyanobacterium]|jgi:prepilin-type N-terminal cleavage/methylation domain-containing protein